MISGSATSEGVRRWIGSGTSLMHLPSERLAQSSARVAAEGGGLARILVTGAAGFIGRALCRGLAERGHAVLGLNPAPGGADRRRRASPDRRHRPADRLVRASRRRRDRRPSRQPRAPPGAGHGRRERGGGRRGAGARRGERRGAAARPYQLDQGDGRGDPAGSAVSRTDPPRPAGSPTAAASSRSSRRCKTAARQTGLELVILRPPLVYGPGVKANFRALLRLVGERAAAALRRDRQPAQPDFYRQSGGSRGACLRASRRRRPRAAGPRRGRSVDAAS